MDLTFALLSLPRQVLMVGDEGGRVRAYEVADVNLRPAGVVGIPSAQAARLAAAMKTGP